MLLQDLARASPGPASTGRVGGGFDATQAALAQAALLEEIEASMRAERMAIVVNALAIRVLLTPLQLVKVRGAGAGCRLGAAAHKRACHGLAMASVPD